MAAGEPDQDPGVTPGSSQERPAAPAPALTDPLAIGRNMADVAELSHRLVADWLRRQVLDSAQHIRSGESDPLGIGGAFMEMTARLMARPAGLMQTQLGFWHDYLTLWQNSGRRMWGLPTAPVIQPGPGDARFAGEAWKDGEVFDFIKQSYLLSARYVQDVTGHVEGLSPRTRRRRSASTPASSSRR